MKPGLVPARVTVGLLIALNSCAASPVATPVALRVQTQGLSATADAGESGASSFTRAIIEVLVTQDGVPVEDLAPFSGIGNETGPISLPPQWRLSTLVVAPFGCTVEPIRMHHPAGIGYYSISVVPFIGNPACQWRSGTYSYVVTIRDGNRAGSGLGVITIP